jgi:hypothetical protein
MRSGKLDYETGKWVDAPPPPTVPQPEIIVPPPPIIHAVPPPVDLSAPAPSAADKARLLIQQRQGRS